MTDARRYGLACWVTIAALLGLVACSGDGIQETATGPGGAVQRFYQHLNAGHYSEAKALYTAEALAVIDDPDATEDMFGAWAQIETKKGSISQVEILDATEGEGTASVEFEIRYADGSSVQRKVTLIEDGGVWKLGLIA